MSDKPDISAGSAHDPVIPPPSGSDLAIDLITAYRAWHDEAEYALNGSGVCTFIRRAHHAEQSLAAIRAERDAWKANHDEMVARNGVLRVRNDLPLDRTDALRRYDNLLRDYKARIAESAAALKEAKELLGELVNHGRLPDDAHPTVRAAAAFLARESP